MTEAEWLAATHPAPMLSFLSHGGHRKYRLLVCACCDRVAHFLDVTCRESLTITQAFADGEVSVQGLESASRSVDLQRKKYERDFAVWYAKYAVALACEVDINQALRAIGVVARCVAGVDAQPQLNQSFLTLVPIVHCIFGNPFRPVSLDRSWLTSTVVALAEGIYAERAFDRMPILADALMDAGCDNDEVLNHCRGDSPHVRGCWVVDLLTGRE